LGYGFSSSIFGFFQSVFPLFRAADQVLEDFLQKRDEVEHPVSSQAAKSAELNQQ
jgi:hypothetical protein